MAGKSTKSLALGLTGLLHYVVQQITPAASGDDK